MSEIIFTELRQFNSGSNFVFAIIKYNGLIFFSINRTGGGQVWTYNPITRAFLLNSTFPSGDSVRDFVIGSSSSVEPGKLLAVTGGTDGKMYSYNNDGTWTEEADTTISQVNSIVEYETLFYLGANDDQVYRWDGASLTVSLTAAETGGDISSLFVFDSLLFAGTLAAEIFVFDNSSWSLEDTLTGTGVTKVLCFEEFDGDLYAGSDGTATLGNHVWKRDLVSPVNWIEIKIFDTESEAQTMEVFFDNLYIGTGNDDSIQRYDGTNFVTVKAASADIAGYDVNASFADGNDCLYFGSRAQTTTVGLFAICPRCSDELLISGASPFGWNVGDCDITPEICLIEDGCFCQISDRDDIITVQIQWSVGTIPLLVIENADTGEIITELSFVNIVGLIYEVTLDFSVITNCDNVKLVICDATINGVWEEITTGTALDLYAVNVFSYRKIYIGGEAIIENDLDTVFRRSDNKGLTWLDLPVPDNGVRRGVSDLHGFPNGIITPKIYVLKIRTGTGPVNFGMSIDEGLTYFLDGSVSITSTRGPRQMSAPDTAAVWAIGDAVSVSRSTNGGDTWADVANDLPFNAIDISSPLFSPLTAFALTTGNRIYKTTDAAATVWVLQDTAASLLRSIYAISTLIIIAVGDDGLIRRTTDGGTVWNTIASGTTQSLKDIYIATDGLGNDGLTGWAVGANGTILSTKDAGATWSVDTVPSSLSSITFRRVHGLVTIGCPLACVVGDGGSAVITTSVPVATSECIKVKNDSQCGLLVKYTNDDNFADFDYTNGLVNQIRIEAHFWKIENPQEKSIHVTSAEEVIPLRQVVKRQVMLETGIMPEYMHEKLAIIFSHAAIEIDGITYVAEGDYEHDPFANNYRQVKGRVLLTDKTYTKENIF